MRTTKLEYEQHKPILTADVTVKESKVYLDEQIVEFTLDFAINNIGDMPAYQNRFRACAAPLDNPEELVISKRPDVYELNPIYKGTHQNILFDYRGTYARQGNEGIVVIYFNLGWSNDPKDGKWHEDPYYCAFLIQFEKDTYGHGIISVLPEWIELFEPYVEKLYPLEEGITK